MTTTTTASPYLKVSEAADFLRTTEKAIRNMIDRGQITAFRPEGMRRVLLRRADLVSLVEGGAALRTK